jgi:hypothetical protein
MTNNDHHNPTPQYTQLIGYSQFNACLTCFLILHLLVVQIPIPVLSRGKLAKPGITASKRHDLNRKGNINENPPQPWSPLLQRCGIQLALAALTPMRWIKRMPEAKMMGTSKGYMYTLTKRQPWKIDISSTKSATYLLQTGIVLQLDNGKVYQ